VSSFEGVSQSLQVLTNVVTWITKQQAAQRLWDGGQPFDARIAELRNDLKFIKMELVEAGKKIEGLQKMIREQLDLEQGRRNFILSLAAAVYLPLSFVTSLFGMNMAVTTPEGLVGFSDFTNSTLAGLSADFLNSTRALVSSIETSGSLTWNWKTFGIITGPLLLTMPLSLALGAIFRLAVRSAAYYSTYWRILPLLLPPRCFVSVCLGSTC
jgi:CorA-like Mg2+ transporter protein